MAFAFRSFWGSYKQFLLLMRPFWKQCLLLIIFMILALLLQLPVPILIKSLLDTTLEATSLNALTGIASGILLIAFARLLVSYGKMVLLVKTKAKSAIYLRSKLLDAIFHAPLGYFISNKTGYIASRIDDDVDSVEALLFDASTQVISQCLTFFGGIILSFYLSVELTLVTLVIAIPYVFITKRFSFRIYTQSGHNQELWAQFKGTLIEYISTIKLSKTDVAPDKRAKPIMRSLAKSVDSSLKMDRTEVAFNTALETITSLTPVCIIFIGAYLMIHTDFSIGSLVAFTSNMVYIFGPIDSFSSININLASSLVAVDRVLSILELDREQRHFGELNADCISTTEFKDVSYRYGANESGEGIQTSFSLEKGESLCIIGKSGIGKSTLGFLLLGFDIPERGSIRINGHDYRDYSLDTLRGRIGYVPQDPQLIEGSILENLMLGNPNATVAQVKEVLELACLQNWVANLEDGLNTSVQEAGKSISGGEKQRLALARALLRKPDLLFLDEISSALDPATEENVYKNLFRLPWPSGLIVITHRHSMISLFNKVVQL